MNKYRIYPNDEFIASKYNKLFIKGPIPYPWLRGVSLIGGKALHVGVILWMTSGMVKKNHFKLQLKFFRDWGISRTTLYKNLNLLEEQGYIQIKKRAGKTHLITIREV